MAAAIRDETLYGGRFCYEPIFANAIARLLAYIFSKNYFLSVFSYFLFTPTARMKCMSQTYELRSILITMKHINLSLIDCNACCEFSVSHRVAVGALTLRFKSHRNPLKKICLLWPTIAYYTEEQVFNGRFSGCISTNWIHRLRMLIMRRHFQFKSCITALFRQQSPKNVIVVQLMWSNIHLGKDVWKG